MSSDTQSDEIQMRRALGLQGSSRQAPQQRADQARPRHRFVQDGGVPVVVLNRGGDSDPTAPLRARITELDAALEAERTAHGVTRRTLQETQSSVQALQTRLAHSDLAHDEAIAVERQARREAEDALAARVAEPPPAAVAKPAAPKAPRTPSTLRTRQPREEQPVKWWLPGFREKIR